MIVLFSILMSAILIVIGGAVISKLWVWFLVPMGLPGISVATAIGLSLLGKLLAGTTSLNHNAEDKGMIEQTVFALVLYGVFLLIGYLAHLAM